MVAPKQTHDFISRETRRHRTADPEVIFRFMIENVDWQRVLIEAQGIHFTKDLEHRLSIMGSPFYDLLCGDCVRDALLRRE